MTKDELAARVEELGAVAPDAATKEQLEGILTMIDPRSPRVVVLNEGTYMNYAGKSYGPGDEVALPGEIAVQHLMQGRVSGKAGSLPYPLRVPTAGDVTIGAPSAGRASE